MKDNATMNASQIADFLGVNRSQVTRWKADLGEPVNPGERSPRWPVERAITLGKDRGYLDDRGRRIERPSTRKQPVPLPMKPPGHSQLHYFAPDIAAMFSTPVNTVYGWIHRGLLGEPPYRHGQYPAWPMTAIKKFAAQHPSKAFDYRARRP